MSEHIEKNGIAVDVFRYTIGLGEVHFKNFMSEFEKYISDYPWIKRKNVKFIMSELLINTQFAMLREFLERVKTDDKFPAFFYLTFFINDEFFSAGIDEYGDYFNYNDYFDKSENFLEQLYSTADLENAIDGEKITS